MFRTVCAIVLLSVCGAALSADVSTDERDKLNAFRNAYQDKSQPDHLKTLAMLDGLTTPATWELLTAVVRGDPNHEVRLAAFKRLCGMPTRTPKLAETLANLFDEVKPSDAEMRTAFAAEMGASEFKYTIFEQLVDYGSKMGYPDLVVLPSGNRGDSNGSRIKFRKEFEAYVEAFNKVTGASITAKDKASPATIRRWWNENKDKIGLADRELAKKYAAEDLAKQPKDNPLLPKTAKKKDE
jgi:hypothetical protein